MSLRNRLFVSVVQLAFLEVLLAPPLSLFGQQAGGLLEASRSFYKADYQRAESLTSSYLQAYPESPQGRILLARSLMAQAKYASAFQELRRALRADPNNVDALYYLGQVSVIMSQLEFQQLYAMAPDSARVHQLLAESHRAQEKLDEAEKEYQAALKANPQLVEVLVALGNLTRSKFQFEEAISYYAGALEIEPGNYDAAYGLGASYLYKQEAPKAIRYFRRALSVDPQSSACRLALGDALLRDGQASEAATELKAAIALEPKMRQAYTLLGRAHQRLGQRDQAQIAFKKAQELIQEEMESRQGLFESKDLIVSPSSGRNALDESRE